jgi:hypothetical protein
MKIKKWEDNFNSGFEGNDECASKRALLISGPPGIGKASPPALLPKKMVMRKKNSHLH